MFGNPSSGCWATRQYLVAPRPANLGLLVGQLAICLLLLLVVPFICFVIAVAAIRAERSVSTTSPAVDLLGRDRRSAPVSRPRRTFAVAQLAVQEAIRNRVLVGFGGLYGAAALRRAVSGRAEQQPGPRLSELRADEHELPGAADGAVAQRLQPAQRYQEPHDLHRRDQAGPRQRDRAGADARLCGGRHGHAPGDGADQLRLRHPRPVARAIEVDGSPTWSRRQLRRQEDSKSAAARPASIRTIGTRSRSVPTARAARTWCMGHWHEVGAVGEGNGRFPRRPAPRPPHRPAPPSTASCVIYDRERQAGNGISVGNEWEYRGYIEGGTPGMQTKAARGLDV